MMCALDSVQLVSRDDILITNTNNEQSLEEIELLSGRQRINKGGSLCSTKWLSGNQGHKLFEKFNVG